MWDPCYLRCAIFVILSMLCIIATRSLLCYLFYAIFALLSLLCYLCSTIFAIFAMLSVLSLQCYLCYAIWAIRQRLFTDASRDKCLVARSIRHIMDSTMRSVYTVSIVILKSKLSRTEGSWPQHVACPLRFRNCSLFIRSKFSAAELYYLRYLRSYVATADGNKAGDTSHCVSLQVSACHDKVRLLHSIGQQVGLALVCIRWDCCKYHFSYSREYYTVFSLWWSWVWRSWWW